MSRSTITDGTTNDSCPRRIALAFDHQQLFHDGLYTQIDQGRQIGPSLTNIVQIDHWHNSRRKRSTGMSGNTRTCFIAAVIDRERSSRVRPTVRPKSNQFAAV